MAGIVSAMPSVLNAIALQILYRVPAVVAAPDVARDDGRVDGRVVLIAAGPSGSTVAFGPDGSTVTAKRCG